MANTGKDATITAIKCCGCFAVFAVCGALSAADFCRRFPDDISIAFPLPFAILLAALLVVVFSSTLDRVILTALLTMATWYASYSAAFFAGTFGLGSAIPCALGGFIGGIGLVLCVGVCIPQIVSVKYLAIGAIIGASSALTFDPSIEFYELHLPSGGFPPTPILAFAFWEAIIAAYLLAISTFASVRGTDDSPEEGDVGSFRITPR
jgi:hypothetical protein